MRQLRQQQIREYFFGHGNVTLSPLTTTVDYSQLSIYRIIDSSKAGKFDPGADDDDDDDAYEPYAPQQSHTANPLSGARIYEKITPSLQLQNSLLAIVHAEQNDSPENIRDASVMGYVYVAEVDEGKRKIRLLSPVGGRVPSRAMVWGSWPEEVVDLVG
jgi:polyribonucleotide 5'-hydroxyl-kinase